MSPGPPIRRTRPARQRPSGPGTRLPPEVPPPLVDERRVLVVDDDADATQATALLLRNAGFSVDTAASAEEAIERFRARTYHVLIADVILPGQSGIDLTRAIHQACPATAIVLITGYATVKTAVAALKRGAADYLRKPVVPARLLEQVTALCAAGPPYLPNKLLVASAGAERFEGMTARSPAMHNVFEKVRVAAQSDATVLITGESGTGKDLAARALHNLSERRGGPFIAVHTGAIPRDLIASELFGHERGSFTGATEAQVGKFELAEGGTLFLDEISTMDERTQINLLRVLETFTYTRIGGRNERVANTRVVAATNRDLREMVADGRFREDLYYRLAILNVNLPPLRARREDIALLASEFVAHFARQYRKRVELLPAESVRLLEAFPWPGNVRELRNVIEQAVLLCRGRALSPDLLPPSLRLPGLPAELITVPLGTTLQAAERQIIARTLESRHGNKKETAVVLGISRRSLYNKLAEMSGAAEDDQAGSSPSTSPAPASGSRPSRPSRSRVR